MIGEKHLRDRAEPCEPRKGTYEPRVMKMEDVRVIFPQDAPQIADRSPANEIRILQLPDYFQTHIREVQKSEHILRWFA